MSRGSHISACDMPVYFILGDAWWIKTHHLSGSVAACPRLFVHDLPLTYWSLTCSLPVWLVAMRVVTVFFFLCNFHLSVSYSCEMVQWNVSTSSIWLNFDTSEDDRIWSWIYKIWTVEEELLIDVGMSQETGKGQYRFGETRKRLMRRRKENVFTPSSEIICCGQTMCLFYEISCLTKQTVSSGLGLGSCGHCCQQKVSYHFISGCVFLRCIRKWHYDHVDYLAYSCQLLWTILVSTFS